MRLNINCHISFTLFAVFYVKVRELILIQGLNYMSEDSKPLTPLTPELAQKLYKEACSPDASALAKIACEKHDFEEWLFNESKKILRDVSDSVRGFEKRVNHFIQNPAPTPPQGKMPATDSPHR